MLYACDANWWAKTRFDWRAFSGARVSATDGGHIHEGVDRVALSGHEVLTATPGRIGGGGNSGFQTLNLLAQLGVRSVAMIGIDMDKANPTHWHGKGWPWSPPGRRVCDRALGRWRETLDAAAPAFAAAGLDIVNCSPISALTAYRREPLSKVLDTWLS